MSEIRKMETNMELLEKVLSNENLNKAYKQVYKNKGASGVDGVTIEELFAYIKEHKEEILWQIRNRESITTFITKKLGLIVNVEKSKVARPNQIKYLGFGFYKKINQNKWRPKPHIKSVQKFKVKLRDILVRGRSISLDERLLRLKQLIYGRVKYFRIADMKVLMRETDENARRKLRVII